MFDAVTYGAAVGAAKRYTDEHSGSDDAVKYTEQSLTSEQQAQARENIGASDGDYRFLTNTPPLVKGSGTGGNLNGGTGMNSTTTTAKKNSIAYGDVASANGNYSVAFGYFVQALHDYEIALGKLNQSNADTVFSIGDGTSDSDRHNLIELKTDGRMFLNGNAVKTEGGDDNKLRLGQICGITDAASSAESKTFYQGFKNLLATSKTTSIIFSSTDVSESLTSSQRNIYLFEDFIGYSTVESTVTVAPIAGRTAGISKTGAWIHVKSCYRMFNSCSGVTSLDLSMFDTSEVKNMTNMFYDCSALTTLDISSFDMTNVINRVYMFGGAYHWAGITTLKTPKINPHDNIPLPRTLYSQDGTAYTKLPVTTGTSIELRQSWT